MKRVGNGVAGLAMLTIGAAVMAAAPARHANGIDQVKTGVDAWQAGNYNKAIAVWKPLAAAGDADAQFNLAQAYRLGRGVPADEKAAQELYRKAALQDHYQAQANYGLLLFQNGDRAGAMPWLQKAADHGDARAQYVVGTSLFNGDGNAKDWVRAYALMTRAAAGGLPPAVSSLTEMDKYIPLDQRQKGTALARDLERSAAVMPAPQPRLTPPPRPTQTASVRPVDMPPVRAGRPMTKAPNQMADAVPRATPKPIPAAKAPPAPKVAAATAATPGGKWRIQLGAFGDAGKARALWDKIRARAPGLAGLQPIVVKAGSVTRLQGGPLASKDAANRACASVTASGQACFPVVP